MHGSGLTSQELDPLRYDGQSDHPDEVAGILHSMMPSGVRVLDVGCGTGSVSLIANRGRGNEIICTEPDETRAKVARSRGLTVFNGFLDDLSDQIGLFDVVMSSDVLEHVASSEAFLSSLKRSLRPDGILLISVPNVAHWTVRLMLLFGRFDYEETGIMDATHLRWFTAASLKKLFEHNGLEIIDMRQTAGTSINAYRRGIWKKIPKKMREALIRKLMRIAPLIFGVQHVVRARVVKI